MDLVVIKMFLLYVLFSFCYQALDIPAKRDMIKETIPVLSEPYHWYEFVGDIFPSEKVNIAFCLFRWITEL